MFTSNTDSIKLINAIKDQTEGVPNHLVFVIDIVSVRFGGYFTPDIKTYLQSFTSLQMLTLNDCGIKSLQNFPHLPTLIRLDMVFNQISGDSIHYLKGCRHLQTLMLGANKVEKLEQLAPLTGMKQLLQLDLINNPVSKVPGFREQIFSMFPTITILDTLDKSGKDAYNNSSMVQTVSRVPDSLFDKSAPVPSLFAPSVPPVSHPPVFLPPPPPASSPKIVRRLSRKSSKKSEPIKPMKIASNPVKAAKAAKRSKILASGGKSKAARAGLVFPVARIKRRIKQNTTGLRIGGGSAVYMAAILEYLTAELLQIAGNEARKAKKKRITPSMIRKCLKGDIEMDAFLKGVTIGMMDE